MANKKEAVIISPPSKQALSNKCPSQDARPGLTNRRPSEERARVGFTAIHRPVRTEHQWRGTGREGLVHERRETTFDKKGEGDKKDSDGKTKYWWQVTQ